MEPFIAQIMLFGGNFAPRGWAFCEGQLLPISPNQSLFSIIGTTYGGDGRTTFALPDLRGRVPISPGAGSGLTVYRVGQKGGAETVTLTQAQMPAHSHSARLEATAPIARGTSSATPVGSYIAEGGVYSTSKNTSMAADAIAIGSSGGSQSIENRQPYLAINYIIALEGIYPTRD